MTSMISAKKNSILLKAASVSAIIDAALPKPGDRILIVNSGSGELPLALLARYRNSIELTCTESSKTLMEMTRDKVKQHNNCRVLHFSPRNLKFAGSSFDMAIAANTIDFVKDKSAFLEDIRGLLKTKGYLIMTSNNPVGILAWFRELDWRLFDDAYEGRVDRKKTSKLFKQAHFKLLKTKTFKVLSDQEIYLFKGVKESE